MDVNHLLSTLRDYWRKPVMASPVERAEAVMVGAAALKRAIMEEGGTLVIYSVGEVLLYHTSEELAQHVASRSCCAAWGSNGVRCLRNSGMVLGFGQIWRSCQQMQGICGYFFQ